MSTSIQVGYRVRVTLKGQAPHEGDVIYVKGAMGIVTYGYGPDDTVMFNDVHWQRLGQDGWEPIDLEILR